MESNLLNTKGKIFYKSAKLFAQKGYLEVSMRDIASEVGIKAGSIYNHYVGKEEILNEIFDYCTNTMNTFYRSIADIDALLKENDVLEILDRLIYRSPPDQFDIMMNSLNIVLREQFRNKRAQSIYKELLMRKPRETISSVLPRLIEKEMLPPCNIEQFSSLWVHSFVSIALEACHNYLDNDSCFDSQCSDIHDLMSYLFDILINQRL